MSAPASNRLRLDHLARRARGFEIVPDDAARASLAERLGLIALKKVRFAGVLAPDGSEDWRLDADLGATVVQPCGLTLAPVTSRIDEPVARVYRAALSERADLPAEAEMPDDVEEEPLPGVVDLDLVLEEALSLALPAFPRADGAEMGTVEARPAGAAPFDPDEGRPFAGLGAALKGHSD